MTHVTHMKSNDGKHANWCLVLRMGVVLMAAIVFAVMLLPAEAHASYRVKSPDIPTEGVSAIELDGEASVSCESYGCVWLMFTPSKTGWYEFTSKGSVDSYGEIGRAHV